MPEEMTPDTSGDVSQSSAASQSSVEGNNAPSSLHDMFSQTLSEIPDETVASEEVETPNEEDLSLEPENPEEVQEGEELAEGEVTKQTARSKKFKEIEERNQKLESDLKNFEKYHAHVETFGGVEALNTVVDTYSMLTDPTKIDEAWQFVSELPHAEELSNKFFFKGMESLENRMVAINDVLKNEYGIESDVDFDTIDAVLTLLAANAQDEKKLAEFKTKINEELSEMDYLNKESFLQKKVEKLESKVEELTKQKTQPDNQNTPEDAEAAKFASFKKSYDEFADSLLDNDILPLAKGTIFEITKEMPKEVQEAKASLFDKVMQDYDQAMKKSDAHKAFLKYLKEGKQGHAAFAQLKLNYTRICKATFQSILKNWTLALTPGASVKKPTAKQGVKQPDLSGRTSIATEPKQQQPQKQASLSSLIAETAEEIMAGHA